MTSILDPEHPAGAFDAFVGGASRASQAQRAWVPGGGPLPALYLSHGAPPLFDDARWIRELFGWAQRMPKPRGHADALSRGDVDTLAACRSAAPGMPYAHPTVDHYIPLFITLGAAAREDQPAEMVIEGCMAGLSRRSFQVS